MTSSQEATAAAPLTDTGTGPAVLWLLPDDATGPSPLADRLAQNHRVVTLASSANARSVAAVSSQLGEFVLIGQSRSAAAALTLAHSAGASCAALVLIAPVLTAAPAEAVPNIPILLLLGTNDTLVPPGAAAALSAILPRPHPILIYGAGHALDRERVEAVTAVILDFIDRRDKFIVRDTSDLLYP